MKMKGFRKKWCSFWVSRSSLSFFGRLAARLASWGTHPYFGRIYLARIYKGGYISPHAQICHNRFKYGPKIFIDDRALVYEDVDWFNDTGDGGSVEFGMGVHIHRDTVIQTGAGGSLLIGDRTHIQPRCQISAYVSEIRIGSHVEIAPNCAFYPYNHGTEPGENIAEQAITSKGGIVIEDDVWLGFGVIVLDGVTIGKGAVIGAGSVVTSSIPANAIAVGNPARVVKSREPESGR